MLHWKWGLLSSWHQQSHWSCLLNLIKLVHCLKNVTAHIKLHVQWQLTTHTRNLNTNKFNFNSVLCTTRMQSHSHTRNRRNEWTCNIFRKPKPNKVCPNHCSLFMCVCMTSLRTHNPEILQHCTGNTITAVGSAKSKHSKKDKAPSYTKFKSLILPNKEEKKKTVAPIFKCLLDGYIARHFSCKQCESTRHCSRDNLT